MNISKLIRAINKAKVLRKALPFHNHVIHGIDVSDEQYPMVLRIVNTLFKTLKSNGFDIQISHWGEIMVIEPFRQIKVTLSIGYFAEQTALEWAKAQLEEVNFFEASKANLYQGSLQLRFRAYRPGTKWRSFTIESLYSESPFAQNIVEQILERTASLTSQSRVNDYYKFGEVSIDDVIALARYGAALYGRSTALFSFVMDKHISPYPHQIIIDHNQIQACSFNKMSYPYTLNNKDLSLMKKLLPRAGEQRIELMR